MRVGTAITIPSEKPAAAKPAAESFVPAEFDPPAKDDHPFGVPKDWENKPSYKDQFVDDRMVRFRMEGPMISTQFVMSNPDDVAALNRLQAEAFPPTAPRVLINAFDRTFDKSKGSFVVFISYSRVYYATQIKP